MDGEEQRKINRKVSRPAGWSALSLEPPGHVPASLTRKDGVGSHSRTLRIINHINHGQEAEIPQAKEKHDIGWGPWLEEGLCITPHANDLTNQNANEHGSIFIRDQAVISLRSQATRNLGAHVGGPDPL